MRNNMTLYIEKRIINLMLFAFYSRKKYFYKIKFGILILDLQRVLVINVKEDKIDITSYNSKKCNLFVDIYFSIFKNDLLFLLTNSLNLSNFFNNKNDSVKLGGYEELIYCFEDIFLESTKIPLSN